MHTLLTGGLGFIGHHTVEHFLKETDWTITVLDSLRFAGRVERLTDIEGYDPHRVRVFWHDLRSPIHDMLMEQVGWEVDWVINMASDSHVDRSISDPVPFVHNNVMLALNALEYAGQMGARFLQVSTDEVYGPAPAGISHKESDLLAPSNPYSASKAAQEHIAGAYANTYGIPLLTTRTMNNIGERQDVEKFLPKTIRSILKRHPVVLHGSEGAWSSRVWLHARNHADALRFLIEADERGVWNVAGEREINVYRMAQMVADILGMEWTFEAVDFHTSRPGHDLRYSLDGGKLAAAGWVAPVGLEESLERTVEWYRANPHWL